MMADKTSEDVFRLSQIMTNGTGFSFASNYFLIELSNENSISTFFKRFFLRLDTRAFAYYESNGQLEIKEVYRLRSNEEPLILLPYATWKPGIGLQLLDERCKESGPKNKV